MHTPRLLVFTIVLAALAQVSVAEDAEIRIEEKDFKLAAEYLAANDVCADARLRELANLDSESCEDDLAFYSKVCWPQFDGLNLSFEAADDDESREKFISVSLLYGSCVRSELLRQVVRKHDSESHKNEDAQD